MIERFVKDIKKYYGYASYAARSELLVEISEFYLGWLWWIIEPLFFMVLYMFIFGYIFQSKIQYISVFIFLGITLWNFCDQNIVSSVALVRNYKHILSKVYLPKFILIIQKILVSSFKMMISFMIVFFMIVFFRIQITTHIFWILPLIFLLFIFIFGFTTIILHFGVYIQDLQKVINILLRIMFFLTGIFYSIDDRLGRVSPKLAYVFQHFNPFAFIITSFRNVMIYSKGIEIQWYFIWLVISILVSLLGVYTIYNNEDNYVKVI